MAATFLKTPMKVVNTHKDQVLFSIRDTGGTTSADITLAGVEGIFGTDMPGALEMLGAGMSWISIIQLFFKYGPIILQIGNDLIASLRSAGGLTLQAINDLINRFGPQVKEMIDAILKALGLAWPT